MHNGGTELVNLPLVRLSGEIFPRRFIPFADLIPVKEVAGML